METGNVVEKIRLNDLVTIEGSKYKGKQGVVTKINTKFVRVKIEGQEKDAVIGMGNVKVIPGEVFEMPHEDQLQPVTVMPPEKKKKKKKVKKAPEGAEIEVVDYAIPESKDVGGLDADDTTEEYEVSPSMLDKLKALALGQPLPCDNLSDHPSEDEAIDISDKIPDIDEALSLRQENEDLKKELKLRDALEAKSHMLEESIRAKDIDIHYLEDELEKYRKLPPAPMEPTPNYKTINIVPTWSSEQVGFLIKHLKG
jgi:ribosomal protein L24